jgi:putative copper export protein
VRGLYLATVAVHVVAAAVWLGSMAFVAAVLVPALRGREGTLRAALLADTGRRLRAIVWPLYAVLVATGLAQLALRGHRWSDVGGALWEGPAGRTLALKLVLFAVTLAVSAAHDFVLGPRATAAPAGSPASDHGRLCASRLGRVAALLALGIVACAVAYVRGGFPWLG